MPRPARIRQAKTKRIPLAYQLNEEIASLGALVISKHHIHFGGLRNFKIGYVLVSGGRAPKQNRVDGVWARFVKVAPLWKGITGYDAIVWVRKAAWDALDAHQREALIAHDLSHGTDNDKGELTVVRHDLEDFAWVARHYGPWTENVQLYGRQLNLFGTPDGQAPGEQRPRPSNVTPLPKRGDAEQPVQ